MDVGKREVIYLSLHCHHQNDSCIKMGSDESHFNVSLIVRDKVTRPTPQTTTFEEKGEPKRESNRGPSAYQPTALPLDQTSSLKGSLHRSIYIRLMTVLFPGQGKRRVDGVGSLPVLGSIS